MGLCAHVKEINVYRSVTELRGYSIRATDGDIGSVHDFYFDDQGWSIRYLVVESGNWLVERQVLINPVALGQPDLEGKSFPVDLTRQQVEESPPISKHQPVSRQMEEQLHQYYGWHPFWRGGLSPIGLGAAAVAQVIKESEQKESQQEAGTKEDPHLRSTQEVIGYEVRGRDGVVGKIDDFIVDDDHWRIRHLVVEIGSWLSGKLVIVSPMWIQEVDWKNETVSLDFSHQVFEDAPEFDPSYPINREYEVKLYDYYGRPVESSYEKDSP